MIRLLSLAYFVSFLLVSVFAQTQTVPDPNGGPNSIVEVVTIDPNSGEPTTVILSSIVPTPTDPADQPDAQQGPVGAPPDTATLTGPAPLIYTYTTAGEVITATFEPTYQQPNPTTPLSSGSVWSFSEYTQQFGGAAAATHGAANSLMATLPSAGMWTAACGVLAIAAGGVLFV